MTKKTVITLADRIRAYNDEAFNHLTHKHCASPIQFTHTQLSVLADFCQSTNPHFQRQRWLDYIHGKCGPNGGKVTL